MNQGNHDANAESTYVGICSNGGSHKYIDPKKAKELEKVPEFIKNPDKTDKIIFLLFAIITVYNMCMLPLKPFLLNHPWVSVTLTGSRTGMIISGAQTAVHGSSWIAPLILGLFGAVKFMPLFWFIGKKWGREYIDMTIQQSKRMQKWYPKIEKFTINYSPLAIFSCYIPGSPVPLSLVMLILGEGGLSLKKFITITSLTLLVVQSINLYLGYTFGDPVIAIVEEIAKYSLWISLALVVWVMYAAIRNQKKQNKESKNN